jgi:adenylate cyclase
MLRIRIGIHSGRVSAGQTGGHSQGQYTPVGDTVNAARRIEQLGKELILQPDAATILVSARTAESAGAEFRFVSVGEAVLAGRHGTEQIMRLVLPAS